MSLRNKSEEVIGRPNDEINYRRYLNEIGKFKPFTKKEEIQYFNLFKEGDHNAYNKIVNHNLRFVIRIAKTFDDTISGSNLTLEDLIGEGNVGLINAVNRFDVTKGFKFISFAVFYIRASIMTYIQTYSRIVRMDLVGQKLLFRLMLLEAKIEQEHCDSVSEPELYDRAIKDKLLKTTQDPNCINKYRVSGEFSKSIYDINNRIEGTTIIDSVANENDEKVMDKLQTKQMNKFINNIIEKDIPHKNKEFVIKFFGLNGEKQMKIKDIATEFNISKSQVSYNIQQSLIKVGDKQLKNYKILTNN